MDTLSISRNKLSRDEIFKGLGGSILVHGIVFALALLGPWILPRDTFKGTVYTVNLVTMQDIGIPVAAPKKGAKDGVEEGGKAQSVQKGSTASRSRSGPLVPVKRLQMDEASSKPPVELKKLNAPEVAKLPDKPMPTASVDKELDNLVPKPKPTPKPAPVTQTSRVESPRPAAVQEQSNKAGQASSGTEKSGPKLTAASQEPAAKGSAEGSSKGQADGVPGGGNEGGAKGTAGAGAVGSPDGGRVASALLSMYGNNVRELVSRNWAVPDNLKALTLEVRLLVEVNRDGTLRDLKVERSSGNSLFDEAAVRAVRKAAPLPPLPQVITYPKVEFGMRFRPEGIS